MLSLPLAFQKCGVALATALMALSAIVTDRSLQMLCLGARRTGATSYGEVAHAAFGERMEWFVSLLLFVFLLFVLVAYMVLIRDIWTPLVAMALNRMFGIDEKSVFRRDDAVLLVIFVLLSPFLVQRTLHALRFNCYIGFCSVSILCFALCQHALLSFGVGDGSDADTGTIDEGTLADNDIRFAVLPNIEDVLFAFPIIMLSFLCHFNVVPIQEALIRPSRKRMECVISTAIGACFFLMYLFGLGGYLYAGSKTQGNILLNVSDDWIFLLGRFGCGITLVLASPLMLLPCRESVLEVLDVYFHTEDEVAEIHVGERTSLLRHDPIQKDRVFRNPVVHYGSTLLIVVACYVGAVAVDGVAIVWSLCGSSMAFLIAFIIPAACFLRIEHATSQSVVLDGLLPMLPLPAGWIPFAWALLVFATAGAIVCTYNTVSQLSGKR